MLAREINAREKIKHLFDGFSAARTASAGPVYQAANRFNQFIEGFSSARFIGERQVVERFAHFKQLLEGYKPTKDQSASMSAERAQRFQALAGRFAELRRRSVNQARAAAQNSHQKFQGFIAGFSNAFDQWAEGQRGKADRFNVLELLGLKTNEMSHSRMLAWLLDRNYCGHGTHAQGSLGFKLFLAELRLPTELADARYVVRQEVPGDDSRIDIEVAKLGRFVMHIEVKIRAPEGHNHQQTTLEWENLRQRAEKLAVKEDQKDGGIFALYITPSGQKPSCDKFRPVTWQQVANVFYRFADEAQAGDVRLFARHYAGTLERFIIGTNNQESEEHHA